MKWNRKLMGVILCGTVLLASGCGAQKEAASVSETAAVSAASAV